MKTNTNNIEWNQDKVTTSFFPQTLTIFFLHIYLNPKIDRISMLPIGVSVNVWVLEFKSFAFLVKIRPKCKTRRRGLSKGRSDFGGRVRSKILDKTMEKGEEVKNSDMNVLHASLERFPWQNLIFRRPTFYQHPYFPKKN